MAAVHSSAGADAAHGQTVSTSGCTAKIERKQEEAKGDGGKGISSDDQRGYAG